MDRPKWTTLGLRGLPQRRDIEVDILVLSIALGLWGCVLCFVFCVLCFVVQGSGFRVQGPGFRVQGSGFSFYGFVTELESQS